MKATLLKTGRFTLRIGTLLIIALAITYGGLGIWLSSSPRPAVFLKPILAQALTPPDGGYKLAMADPVLAWGGGLKPLKMEVKNVTLTDSQENIVAVLPELEVTLAVSPLFVGRMEIDSLLLKGPLIAIPQKLLEPSQGEATGARAILHWLEKLRMLERIDIRKASLSIATGERRNQWLNFDMTAIRKFNGWRIGFVPSRDQAEARIEAEVQPAGEGLAFSLKFRRLIPSWFKEVLPNPEIAAAMQIPLSGSMNGVWDGEKSRASFAIEGAEGIFDWPEWFPKPLAISWMELTGEANATRVAISRGGFGFGPSTLTFSGQLTKEEQGWKVLANTEAQQVLVDRLSELWPLTLAPETRAWVTGRITGGMVPHARASIHLEPGDLALPFLPDRFIEADVEVDGARVDYAPPLPPAEKVSGIAHFTGETMKVNAKATLLTGSQGEGTVEIDNFNAPLAHILVDLNITTNANDVATFLASKTINLADELGLKPGTLEGTGKGEVHLDIDYPSEGVPIEGDEVDYGIAAAFKGLKLPTLLGEYALEQGNFTFALNNDGLNYKGEGRINGMPMALDGEEAFRGAPYDRKLAIESIIPVEKIGILGLPPLSFMTGEVGAKIELTESKRTELVAAEFMLDHARIQLPMLGLDKPSGQPSRARFVTRKKAGGNLVIDQFAIKLPDSEFGGSAEVGGDFFPKNASVAIKTPRQDMLVSLKEMPGDSMDITVSGKRLDVSEWLEKRGDGKPEIPPMDLKVDLATVILGDGRALGNLKGNLRCDAQHCMESNFKGNYGENKNFTSKIGAENGKRIFAFQAEDAGAFLKTVNIADNIKGGALTMDGVFDDSKPLRPLTGMIRIDEHRWVQAPALTQLLSIGFLTGFLDTLRGGGIAFDKLRIPYTLADGTMTVKDARIVGASLGLTASGTVNLNNDQLDLEGTIVPSYIFNSMVSKIPIIGDILAGGKDQGIIAANYSLKGDFEDPKVGVNPLSVLTPGFLRGIFDVFDADKQQEGQQPGAAAKPAP